MRLTQKICKTDNKVFRHIFLCLLSERYSVASSVKKQKFIKNRKERNETKP